MDQQEENKQEPQPATPTNDSNNAPLENSTASETLQADALTEAPVEAEKPAEEARQEAEPIVEVQPEQAPKEAAVLQDAAQDNGWEADVISDKQLRKDTDEIIQRVKALAPSRERSLAITKLQEAVMWLGMDLKRLGTDNPYPNSKDPSNTKIEPTADGMKM